ncbi:MAG: hypothetical protein F6K41_16995, partial [Symploca sp. SIO3E6]|nr:hypothetical protein [Caldora sp. SIO3E6]
MAASLFLVVSCLFSVTGLPAPSYAYDYGPPLQVGVPLDLATEPVDISIRVQSSEVFIDSESHPTGTSYPAPVPEYDIVTDFKTHKVFLVPHSVTEALVTDAQKVPIPQNTAQVLLGNYVGNYYAFFDEGIQIIGGIYPLDLNKVAFVSFSGQYLAFADPTTLISSTIPTDIPGGAPNATLSEAAVFAWKEFIALNWPAAEQSTTPGASTPREQAADAHFGQSLGDGYAHPLVWETFRHKAEIYPGKTSGITNTGNYNTVPDYYYDKQNGASIPPCEGAQDTSKTAWVNLDEGSEIGRATMYAGIVDLPSGPEGEIDQDTGAY